MIRAFQKGVVPIAKIQIFGERCSGTNFLESLLQANIRPDILTSEFGWKHWFRSDTAARRSPECLFLVIYRNAAEWLKSFHRNPWHAAPELKEIPRRQFLRGEWHSVFDEVSEYPPGHPLWHTDIRGDLDPQTGARFRNVIAMRNAKVAHFESLRKRFDNVCYLRYEDLRADPEGCIRVIAARYGLPLPDSFQPAVAYKGYGRAYAPHSYTPLDLGERIFILRQLNLLQEYRIGYSPLSILRS